MTGIEDDNKPDQDPIDDRAKKDPDHDPPSSSDQPADGKEAGTNDPELASHGTSDSTGEPLDPPNNKSSPKSWPGDAKPAGPEPSSQDSNPVDQSDDKESKRLFRKAYEFLKRKCGWLHAEIAKAVGVQKYSLECELRESEERLRRLETDEGFFGSHCLGASYHDDRVDQHLLDELPQERPPKTPSFDLPGFEERIHELRQLGFLVVASRHDAVLRDVQYRIIDSIRATNCYVLTSYSNLVQGEPVAFRDVLNAHHRQLGKTDASAGFQAITFVHVTDRTFRELLDAFISQPDFHDQFVRPLRGRKSAIVCQIFLGQLGEFQLRADGMEVWSIDWLMPVLRGVDMGCTPEQVRDQLQVQRDEGLWPESDHGFYLETMKFLRDSPRALVDEIERRARLRASSQDTGISIAKANVVQRAAMFTTAYFAQLDVQGFDVVMRALLIGKTIEVERVRQVTTKKGKIKDHISYETMGAFDEWKANRVQFRRDCRINAFANADGKTYFDFPSSIDSEHIRREISIDHSPLDYEQFEQLCKSGVLFRSETPREVVSMLIDLAGEMAKRHPGRYNDDWLLETILAVEASNPELHDPQDSAAVSQWVARINDLNRSGKESYFYPRIADLCRRLIENPKSKRTVENLFQRLITVGKKIEMAPEIALRLIRRLRQASDFDYFDWLRRVLDHAPSKTRLDVMHLLIEHANEGVTQLDEVMRELERQHPAVVSPGTDSRAGLYALAFLYEYCGYTQGLFERAFDRGQSTAHPLFPDATSDILSDVVERRIDRVAHWLVHPTMKDAVTRVIRDTQEAFGKSNGQGISEEGSLLLELQIQLFSVGATAADAIEAWTEMADRIESAGAHHACERLAQRLVEVGAQQRGDKSLRREVCSHWTLIRNICLERQQSAAPQHRRSLSARRKRLWRLIKSLTTTKTIEPVSQL